MVKAKKVEKENVEQKTEEEPTFIAEVISLHGKGGSGGSVTTAKVLLQHNNRTLIRSIYGPVRIGDKLQLKECVRESRRIR